MKIVLVYNPKAGSKYTAADLRKYCKEHGVHIEELIPVNDILTRALAPSIKRSATIAVVGGDGTLSAVAGMIAGTEAVFAPLPGGTLNHFTKDLGIDQDISKAISRLPRATVHALDVGEVNGTVFINNSSIGLYSSSLRERDRFEPYIGKWLAAAISSIRVLIFFRTYMVTIKGETFHTPFVFVGNNIYSLEGIGGAKRESLTGGVLSVFIARTTSRLVLFKIVLLALVGRTHLLDEFDERKTKELSIQSRRKRLNVSRDGEVTHEIPPLIYGIKPSSLRALY